LSVGWHTQCCVYLACFDFRFACLWGNKSALDLLLGKMLQTASKCPSLAAVLRAESFM